MHDIDPAASNAEEIRWEIIGEFPNRVLAVSFYNVEMYSCSDLFATHMIVLYETTNVIDIYIQNKPSCNSWQGGVAAVGIQNDAGNQGFVPPGRNSSDSPWTTEDEAWRFTPAGEPILTFEWLNSFGEVISTNPEIDIAINDTQTYTAKVTYTTCTGNPIVVEDDITITVEEPPYEVDIITEVVNSEEVFNSDIVDLCDDSLPLILDAQYESETATYQWFLNNSQIDNQNSQLTITSSTSGEYRVVVVDEECQVSDEVIINFGNPDNSLFEMAATCDGGIANILGVPGGSFAFNVSPEDGAIIDPDLGIISGGSYETTYSVLYTTNDACPSSSVVEVTSLSPDNSLFEMAATCDGGIANILGVPGGSFAFNVSPEDGAIIDPDLGIISGGSYETTYSVLYTTNDACPSSSVVEVTSLSPDNSLFEMAATCDGGIANILGVPGGSFAFNVSPEDGAIIDPDLGIISGGSYETTYSVLYTTNDACPSSSVVEVTSLSPDNSLFEMAATCDGGIANILGVPGGSFAFNVSPEDGAIIDPDLGIISGGSYETTYSVLYTTNDACPSSSVVEVTSLSEDSPLEITDPSPLEVCDDNIPDGLVEIDLTLKNSEITNGNPNYSVSYFFNQNDAINNNNPLSNNYTNISNPQTIYVRVYDLISNCSATTSLTLSVIYAPSATSPPDLEYCDPDADGFGVFDLTSYNDIISQGQSGLTISYHETEADAENNVNAIVGEYNNIVAYEQTVYIRVESSSVANDCGTILSMNLIVNDVPQINTEPSSLFLCDDNTDGFGIFDLSASSEELLNGLDPSDFTITYYEAEDDAQNGLNAIVTPYNYTNTTAFNQFVWVRIENSATACYNVGSIELIINELPVLTQPSPLNLCDDNNSGDEVEGFTLEDSIGEVLQGQTGINISFHESQEDADNAVNALVSPYNNTANAQTIYVRGEDEITGCYATITLDLRVNPIPSPVAPEPIEECDDDNDGFTFFTLETNEEEIINGELDIILSYYSTLTNAQNDVNPIISPYYNIVPDNQIIYVRAENELTGCFTIVEQELITIYSPEIPLIIEDIVACDDDYDDIALFDLTEREEDILGEQSSSEMILTYHESLLDAETGDSPIINTTSYQNLSNPQTIYVRLEDTVNGCVNIGTFNLVVTLPPVIVQAEPLQECDDEIADQITEFDLTIKDSEITGGNIDWEVIYYETQQDAFNAINPIENPEAYSNTSVEGNPANPQTLYVAVINEFGCIAYNYLTIEVLPTPTPNLDPSNIEQCDNNNAGDLIEIFDITVHEDYILNGESGVSIAYHESLEDALSGINPIADPSNYANVIPGVQTVYVAVTKDITGCPTVVTFDIIVNPLPDISTVADIVICEVNTDNVYEFNLDEITVQLLGSQDVSNFTVTYHETQQDAEDSLNVLTSPYANTASPQQLFVNISNNTTGCFVTGAGFTLDVQEAAVANTDAEPAVLGECDIDNDGFAEFILTELNNDILDGLDANDFTVSYYENLQDAEDSSNALPNNYTNTSSPQIIYVRLDNDTDPSSQCYDITTATLIVNELPFFSLEASYMGCENANGSEVVDSLMETNLPESEYDFEWYDPTGTLVATTSSYFPTMAGTYTATVTNELTGCQYSTTTEVYTSATAVVSAAVTTLAFAQEHVIQATATGIGDYEFRLDTGPWQLDGTFNNVSPGLHTVYVRDLNGCGIGTATVLVVDYPRFFTPNGDGYNDTWHIIGADLHPGLVASDIYIFDRYGKLLKKLDPQGEGWDGTYNGRPMPSTDYWFTIEYQIPALNVTRRFRAHFSLKR